MQFRKNCRKLSDEEIAALKKQFESEGVVFIDAPMAAGKADIMSDDPAEILKAMLGDKYEVKFP